MIFKLLGLGVGVTAALYVLNRTQGRSKEAGKDIVDGANQVWKGVKTVYSNSGQLVKDAQEWYQNRQKNPTE